MSLPELDRHAAYARSLSWVPTRTTQLVTVGSWWDAIRVREDIAIRVYEKLGDRGPVLANPYSGVWHFLLDLGSISEWRVPSSRRMRAGSLLAVPPGRLVLEPEQFRCRSRDVHWAVPPGCGRTEPAALRKVLRSRHVHGGNTTHGGR